MDYNFAAMLTESRRRRERVKRIQLVLVIVGTILFTFLALTIIILLYKYYQVLSFDTILPVFTSSVYKVFINSKDIINDFCTANPYVEQFQNAFLSQFNSHDSNHLQGSAIFINEYWIRFRYISMKILSVIFDSKEAQKTYFEIEFI